MTNLLSELGKRSLGIALMVDAAFLVAVPFTPPLSFWNVLAEALIAPMAFFIFGSGYHWTFYREYPRDPKVDMRVSEVWARDKETFGEGWDQGYTNALRDIMDRIPILVEGEVDPVQDIYNEGFDDGVQEGYERAYADAEEDAKHITPQDSGKTFPKAPDE